MKKKSPTPLNNLVSVSHAGDGVLEFQIPHFSESIHLRPETEKKNRDLNEERLPPQAHIYLFLLKTSNYLRGKKSAFYIELLQDGFLRKGAVTLIGWIGQEHRTGKSRQMFKTVIQLDGDIICKVDRNLLSASNIDAQMAGYFAVLDQLLEGFQQTFCSIVAGALAVFSAPVLLFYLIRMVYQWGSA